MVWNIDSIPQQDGRIAIVTGANSGIGFETARALAQKGARVILACRNADKGNLAVQKILTENPTALVEFLQLDLSRLESVKSFADGFAESFERLDLLINNAGVMMPPYTKTADGFELQFGTNHLGHFALTARLLPLLTATADSRVVNVSSMAHKGGKIHFNNLDGSKGYGKIKFYGQSKLANLLFTYELQRRLAKHGHRTLVTAAHPGWTATNLQRTASLFEKLNPYFAQKPLMGALPTLYAATATEAEAAGYYGPAGFMEMKGYPRKVRSNKRSHDEDVARRLWSVSEDLTGVSFQIGSQR